MPVTAKEKKRGFVMTGGGAKGLYEAGVIHAFHITGMDFDVVTGSSIGAMNAIVYAEYLRRKRCLPEAAPGEGSSAAAPAAADDSLAAPLAVIEQMDPFVRAFHHAWLRLESLNLVDDSDSGPLGRLQSDLTRSGIALSQLARLGWWWTTPEARRGNIPWNELIPLMKELVERIGLERTIRLLAAVPGKGLKAESLVAAYLERMGLRNSLIGGGSPQENGIRDTFTRTELVLQPDHLEEDYIPHEGSPGPRVPLLDPHLTLADYQQAGIEVRLTRANFRTGRLELSNFVTPEAFVAYLLTQAWRLQTASQDTPPLGSHRIHVPGNPSAIGAALASGRFPGVFAPYPVDQIYDLARPENELLARMLDGWLRDPGVEREMFLAFTRLGANIAGRSSDWEKQYTAWRESKRLCEYFPRRGDAYVDGGAIDNTPTNSAVDAVREWIYLHDRSKREVALDLYVVFLHPEPSLMMDENPSPALYQVVGRSMKIANAAKLSADAALVSTINTFGMRGEQLGESLQALLEGLKPTLDELTPEQRRALEDRIRKQVQARGLHGYAGVSGEGVLARMEDWAARTVRNGLPLHVNEVTIYPDRMPMDTLQFTQRLGYRKSNAIGMIMMGCYNTLWALRSQFESQSGRLDAHDAQALALTRRWMEGEWPADPQVREAYRGSWRCRRVECVFHKARCPHGAGGAQ